MEAPQTGNSYLSVVCGISAFISLASIQPVLTFTASIIAIVSGVISIRKNIKR